MPTTATSTPMSEVLALQRAAFHRDGPATAATRRDRIDRFTNAVIAHTDEIVDAISDDFGYRGPATTIAADILQFASEAELLRLGVGRWMKPRRPAGRLLDAAMRLGGIQSQVIPSPLGVVGIMGIWNFPLLLTAVPAVTALAAGNRVMIKMSEKVPATSEVLANAWHDAFDVEEVAVVTGDADVSRQFAALDLDHLFFTGSAGVGSKIMAAAAENLTPVTLELGGKNPVVVSEGVARQREPLRRAAARIAAARLQNGGQACINPDEVYVPSSAARLFVQDVFSAWGETVPDMIETGQLTTIIDDDAFDGIIHLLEDAAAKGAQVIRSVSSDASGEDAMRRDRVMPPIVVLGVTPEMELDSTEVFGPVLTVHTYDDLSEVIDRMATRPAPLVSTWFGRDDAEYRTFVARTRSGGVARNDWGLSFLAPGAPFGGVGRSGMGRYHGRYGFEEFSHLRTVTGSSLPISLTQFTGPMVDDRIRDGLHKAVDGYRSLLRARLRL